VYDYFHVSKILGVSWALAVLFCPHLIQLLVLWKSFILLLFMGHSLTV